VTKQLEKDSSYNQFDTNHDGNPSHFVISLFDLNKSFLGLFVKLTPFFDGSNASVSSKEDADRINLQPQDFFDKLSRKAWAKQHGSDQHVKQILNPRHALVAIGK